MIKNKIRTYCTLSNYLSVVGYQDCTCTVGKTAQPSQLDTEARANFVSGIHCEVSIDRFMHGVVAARSGNGQSRSFVVVDEPTETLDDCRLIRKPFSMAPVEGCDGTGNLRLSTCA